MKKKIFLSAAILAVAVSAYAQGNGQAGITEATNLITGYFDPGTKLVYAIGAVCGLIGGVKVYNKFSSGDPDTSKTAASWFGACIFLAQIMAFIVAPHEKGFLLGVAQILHRITQGEEVFRNPAFVD